MPDRVTRFLLITCHGKHYLDMLQLSFYKLIRMGHEEEEDALLFKPDSAPLPCSHEVRNALNLRYPTLWLAVSGPTPWLSLNPVLSPLDL
jgi:hypothetical protein